MLGLTANARSYFTCCPLEEGEDDEDDDDNNDDNDDGSARGDPLPEFRCRN